MAVVGAYKQARHYGAAPERKKTAAAAVWSTREGTRLHWWLNEGEGSDARGPLSVRGGWTTAAEAEAAAAGERRRRDPG